MGHDQTVWARYVLVSPSQISEYKYYTCVVSTWYLHLTRHHWYQVPGREMDVRSQADWQAQQYTPSHLSGTGLWVDLLPSTKRCSRPNPWWFEYDLIGKQGLWRYGCVKGRSHGRRVVPRPSIFMRAKGFGGLSPWERQLWEDGGKVWARWPWSQENEGFPAHPASESQRKDPSLEPSGEAQFVPMDPVFSLQGYKRMTYRLWASWFMAIY